MSLTINIAVFWPCLAEYCYGYDIYIVYVDFGVVVTE